MAKTIFSYFIGTFCAVTDNPRPLPFTGEGLTTDELAFIILDGMARDDLSVNDAKCLIQNEMDFSAEKHHDYLNAAKHARLGITGANRAYQAYCLNVARIMRLRLMTLQIAYNWLKV